MKPNTKNFCGGNFQDWLEVKLTGVCNGRCSWCIEKDGYNPEYHAPWHVIAETAIQTGKKNIILLGGEPTLHKNLQQIINWMHREGRFVWITTNGSMLTPEFAINSLRNVTGINISIHNFDLDKNWEITGCRLTEENLVETIAQLRWQGAVLSPPGTSVRLNCNCINGHIDNIETICQYIKFAKRIGAHKIRFAELKQEDEGFVDLAKILDYKYGLNDNPFIDGCNSDAVINGMPVNFRQMCGLQTSRRVTPENPEQCLKEVLYYDGKIYNGWQTNPPKETANMEDKQMVQLLQDVADGKKTVAEAALIIGRNTKDIKDDTERKITTKQARAGIGCCY